MNKKSYKKATNVIEKTFKKITEWFGNKKLQAEGKNTTIVMKKVLLLLLFLLALQSVCYYFLIRNSRDISIPESKFLFKKKSWVAVLVAKDKGGDKKHAQAIARSLNIIDTKYIDPNKNSLNPFLTGNIIISVGSPALKFLKNNLTNLSNSCVYWGAHQLMDSDKVILTEIAPFIDVIALPAGIIEGNNNFFRNFENIKLINTIAVPTIKLTNKELSEAYNSLHSQYKKINLNKKYILVSLPGDAPDFNSNWKKFNKESTENLFALIQYLWNQNNYDAVLIENGPRTGKLLGFDHTYKTNIYDSIDHISKYFLSMLSKNNIPYQFYPFAFNVDSDGNRVASVSAHKALIYVMIKTNSTFIIPGESTSQIGEIPRYIKPPLAVVFSPSSQNDAHKFSMKKSYDLGLLCIWDGIKVVCPNNVTRDDSLLDTNKVVVELSSCLNSINSHS